MRVCPYLIAMLLTGCAQQAVGPVVIQPVAGQNAAVTELPLNGSPNVWIEHRDFVGQDAMARIMPQE